MKVNFTNLEEDTEIILNVKVEFIIKNIFAWITDTCTIRLLRRYLQVPHMRQSKMGNRSKILNLKQREFRFSFESTIIIIYPTNITSAVFEFCTRVFNSMDVIL